MKVSLVVLQGKQKGRVIPLPATPFLIGRAPQCHLRPHSGLVSRVHCAIAPWTGRVLIRDMKSVNGTFLNKQPVTTQVAARDGDILEVGDLSFEFKIEKEPGDEGLPPPPLDARSLKWLLESPSDSAVLDPAQETVMGQFDLGEPAAESEAAAAADEAAPKEKDTGAQGSGDLSAGSHLREYLHQKKKPRPKSDPNS
jgi:pSer/pThr/pTyr-binding forkhead associated (FHA) protein